MQRDRQSTTPRLLDRWPPLRLNHVDDALTDLLRQLLQLRYRQFLEILRDPVCAATIRPMLRLLPRGSIERLDCTRFRSCAGSQIPPAPATAPPLRRTAPGKSMPPRPAGGLPASWPPRRIAEPSSACQPAYPCLPACPVARRWRWHPRHHPPVGMPDPDDIHTGPIAVMSAAAAPAARAPSRQDATIKAPVFRSWT